MFSKVIAPLPLLVVATTATTASARRNHVSLAAYLDSPVNEYQENPNECSGARVGRANFETGVCNKLVADGFEPFVVMDCNATHWHATFYSDKTCKGEVVADQAGPVGCNTIECIGLPTTIECFVKPE